MRLDSIDKKFEKLGFTKIEDNDYEVKYEKYITEYNYTHCIVLLHKESGRHLIQSYSKENVVEEYFNAMVGMTEQQTKLALKKLKRKKWKAG